MLKTVPCIDMKRNFFPLPALLAHITNKDVLLNQWLKRNFLKFLICIVCLISFSVSGFATSYTVSSPVNASTLTARTEDTLYVDDVITISSNTTWTWNFKVVILRAPNGTIFWQTNGTLSLPNCTLFEIQTSPQAPGLQPIGGSASKVLEINGIKIAASNTTSSNAAYSFDQFNQLGGLPTFTITSNSPVCEGTALSVTATPDRTGTIKYNYNWSISPVSGTFTPVSSNSFTAGTTSISPSAGVYTITCTIDATGDLLAIKTINVTVNALPTVSAITGPASVCVGSQITLANATAGGSWSTSDITKATITSGGVVTGLASGSVTISYSVTNGSGCTKTVTYPVTVNTLPTVYSITGGGSYCSGSTGSAIGLSNSQTGINYQLYNGASAVGSTIAGTNGALNFGLQTAAGTYTVVATNPSGGCTQNMSGSAAVTVNSRPTSVLSGSQIMGNCSPATLSVSLTGTAPWSITYSDGSTSSTINNINSSPYMFTVSPASTKTYTVTALTDSKCTAQAGDRTGSATVTVPAGAAGVWTGAVSSDWYDCRNWADGKTPLASVDVIITSTPVAPQISAASSFAFSFANVAMCRNLTIDNNTLSFANATDALLASGNVTMQNNGTIDLTAGGTLELQGNWNNQVSTAGKGFRYGTGNVIFSGSLTQSISTVNTEELFYNLQISKTTSAAVVNLNSNITIDHNLTLSNGIFATGSNLFTWNNNGGILTCPEPAYTANSTNYTKSFIATCDNTGVPVNVADATTAFMGNAGLRIKNVSNTNTYFPVGASFLPGTVGQPASPNRMMINNQSGSLQDFTVIVNYGDIGYTNGGAGAWKVNRIWYVKSGPAATGKATMQLFFTKRDWNGGNWPAVENEVEAGFLYAQPALLQKDYSSGYGNFINLSSAADITSFIGNANNTEIYAKYTIGTSTSLTDGIQQFNRFSVVNSGNIILPVSVNNLKAYQKGNGIQVDWTALNEMNIDHYEVQKADNGINFYRAGSINAHNNGLSQNNYSFLDTKPVQGNNFYRVKAIGKDGQLTYTATVVVNISGGKTSISVQPNPVQNKIIHLQLNSLAAGKYNMVMYNSVGQRIMGKTIEHVGGTSAQVLALPSNIPAGTYLLKLFNEYADFTSRFIIQ